jgi:hypothetical protein
MNAADLRYPIILCADGKIMDGMHRTLKALLTNDQNILAKKFAITPASDFVDVYPDDLPY